ncbi:hypothetical protein WKI72_20515 [Candidatus Erwinia dacicola]
MHQTLLVTGVRKHLRQRFPETHSTITRCQLRRYCQAAEQAGEKRRLEGDDAGDGIQLQSAQKNWNRLKGFELLTLVVNNLPFKDSEQVEEEASDRNVA